MSDYTPPLARGGLHKCDNCGRIIEVVALNGITDLFERISPGGVVPSGQCPWCDCLCYPHTPRSRGGKKTTKYKGVRA